MYLIRLQTTVKRILLLLAIFTACRFVFLFFNWPIFSVASLPSLTYSMLLGIWFDTSAILFINSLFLFLSLIPVPIVQNKNYQRVLLWLFLSVNLPAIFINLADASYFGFTGKRTTYEIFGIWNDIGGQALQLGLHYWYIPVITLSFMFLLWLFYPKSKGESTTANKKIYSWLIFVLCIGLIVLGIRGGVQLRPISPNMAFVQQPNVLGNLVLNTPFVIIQTAQLPAVQRLHYFANDRDALQNMAVPNKGPAAYKPILKEKPNIVIFILESFSSEYTGFSNPWQGYTPFLDSLSAHGLFFKNHFSNGRTSIEAMPSIVASIPALMRESYITSTYQGNKIKGLPSILNEKGYATSFYHAGRNGTMGFDMFAKNAGYSEYLGRNEYNVSNQHDDGNWGIFDHQYLPYFCKELGQKKEPFFSTIFTLSSHQPYTIPLEFKDQFKEGPVPVIRSIRYADHALRLFFQLAQKQPWFSNTIFIFTADHTQDKIQPWSVFNDYHVPLLWYSPQYIKPRVVENKITQHIDIAPSILAVLGFDKDDIFKFGHSIFDSTYVGRALLFDGASDTPILLHHQMWTLLRPDGKVEFGNDIIFKLPVTDNDEELKKNYSREVKAIQQYHNNGLIDNLWFK